VWDRKIRNVAKMVSAAVKKGVRVQFFSDLHLELERTTIPQVPVKGDVLVLAGDTGDIDDGKFPKFIRTVSHDFADVILIPGNREYYQWSKTGQLGMQELEAKWTKYCSQFPNVHFLNCGTWTHPSGLDFHGCTLWSHVPPAYAAKTEARVFTYKYAYVSAGKKVTVDYTNKLHAAQTAWLKAAVAKSKRCVVITHHVPTLRFFAESYKQHAIVGGLAADLDSFIETSPQIALWICGHAHFIYENTIANTLCSMNCIGYPGDLPDVHFDKVHTIL
jgi:hypothetical protein